jgi:hypothetical protein
MKTKILLGIILISALVFSGCVAGFRAGGGEEFDASVAFDDPLQGWFVQGYWTGGCLNCGIWVAPFWTRDVVVLNQHFDHYRGGHRAYWEQNRHHMNSNRHPMGSSHGRSNRVERQQHQQQRAPAQQRSTPRSAPRSRSTPPQQQKR